MKQSTINKHIANINRLFRDSMKLSFPTGATVEITTGGALNFYGYSEDTEYSIPGIVANETGENVFLGMKEFLKIWKRGNIVSVFNQSSVSVKLATENGLFEIDKFSSDDLVVKPEIGFFNIHSMFDNENLRSYADLVSKDDLRPAMQGIFIGNRNGGGYICATEGSYLKYETANVTKDAPEIIVPGPIFQSLPKDWDGEFWANESGKYGKFYMHVDDCFTKVTFRTIDAEFPDFLAVIPMDNKLKVALYVEDAMKALKVVETVNSAHQFSFVTIDNRVHIHAEDLETGNRYFSSQVGETYPDAGEYKQAFNAKFLQLILKNNGEKFVNIYADSPRRAANIGTDDMPYILMPVMYDYEKIETLGQ